VRITAAELAQLASPRGVPSARPLEPEPDELLAVFVPGKLVNALNAPGWMWQKRKRYAETWKDRVAAALWLQGRLRFARIPPGPKHVRLHARTHNTMDDDGLAASLKPVRDALVDCGVMAGDAPGHGNVFTYTQRIDRHCRGVEIRVAAL
jgi:hypothetical protein